MTIRTKLAYSKKIPYYLNNLYKRSNGITMPVEYIQIEVTDKCNGRCLYCDIWKDQKGREVTPEFILKNFNPPELFESVKEIALTGGEVFLHSNLKGLVKALKQVCPNTSVGAVTNGLLPDLILKTALELKEIIPSFHMGISIDGFSEVDGILRGNDQHFTKAWETAIQLKDHGIITGIGSTVTNINLNRLYEFREFCLENGFGHCIHTLNYSPQFYKHDVGSVRLLDLDRTDKNYKKLKRIVSIGKASTFLYYLPEYFNLENKRQLTPCFSGLSSFYMAVDGGIYPCINFPICFGMLGDHSFEQIWHGVNSKKVRNDIKKGRCHCWTTCEAGVSIKAFPLLALKKKLREMI